MIETVPEIEESYTAYGRISELFTSTAEEVMLTGPAGTGKSRGILEYLNYQAMTYPTARILMVRKTRRSLTESGMVTLERKVLHPAQNVRFKSSVQQYQYPNGSILAVGGLDKPEKILSSEWDIIYPQEATELEEKDWEMCSMRLRNGVVPVQQMVGDCNADKSTHWILQRASAGKVHRLETRHEDNPTYFNRDGTMTPEGVRYLARLDQLTGVRYARYRLGLWVSAEGMVYENSWDRTHNLINAFPIPKEWPRYLVIDFGYTHPFVCLWAAIDPDGRIYIYRQLYMTKRLVEDHAKDIKRVSRWGQKDGDPLPRMIICDHDAEDRQTLQRHLGLNTTPAHKSVSDGIQATASRFRLAGDGKPRLMILRDSLTEIDRDLAEGKRPTATEEEMENYRWDTRQGMKKGEAPIKEDDHGCLVAGTMITTSRGDVPIEQIHVGDYVLTRNGYKPVQAAGMTQKTAKVMTLHMSNGATLTGTGNHPVWVTNKFVQLQSVSSSDILEDITSYKERYPLVCQSIAQTLRSSLSMVSTIADILTGDTGRNKTTSEQYQAIENVDIRTSMLTSGNSSMALFQRVISSIIKTEILSTTILATLSASRKKNTWRGTEELIRNVAQKNGLMQGLEKQKRNRTRGNRQKKEKRLCVNMDDALSPAANHLNAPVSSAEIPSLVLCLGRKFVSVLQVVTRNTDSLMVSLQNSVSVPTVETRSLSTIDGQKLNAVPVRVLNLTEESIKQPVYNLTVENAVGEGEYFANGILVHNCDALRYLVAQFDLRTSTVGYFKDIWR